MRDPRRGSWLAVAALLLTACLWSLNGPLIKLASDASSGPAGGLDGWTIAFYRSLLGGLVFVPVLLRRGRQLARVSWHWSAFSVASFTLMTACFVIATTRTAAASAIILQYTSPAWVFLLGWLLLRERIGPIDLLCLLLALTGVGVIYFGHPAGGRAALVIGLASGLGYGALTVALRGLRAVDPGVVVALNFLGSAALLAPAVGLWGQFALSARQWLLVISLGIVQMALPYALFCWALQRIAATRAALIVLLEAVLNPLWTWLIVHEPVPPPTLRGGPLILASVVLGMVRRAGRGGESAGH